MAPTPRQRILLEITASRDKAEVLLRTLMESKAQSEKHLAELKQADVLKSVTGRSAIDNAIASTQRYIETLNRALEQVRKELTEEDLAALGDAADGTP